MILPLGYLSQWQGTIGNYMLEDNIDGKGDDTKFYKSTMKLFNKALKFYNLLKIE
jgi:hypothetical protein